MDILMLFHIKDQIENHRLYCSAISLVNIIIVNTRQYCSNLTVQYERFVIINNIPKMLAYGSIYFHHRTDYSLYNYVHHADIQSRLH